MRNTRAPYVAVVYVYLCRKYRFYIEKVSVTLAQLMLVTNVTDTSSTPNKRDPTTPHMRSIYKSQHSSSSLGAHVGTVHLIAAVADTNTDTHNTHAKLGRCVLCEWSLLGYGSTFPVHVTRYSSLRNVVTSLLL